MKPSVDQEKEKAQQEQIKKLDEQNKSLENEIEKLRDQIKSYNEDSIQLRNDKQQIMNILEDMKLEIKEIRDAHEKLQLKNTHILQEMQEGELLQEEYKKNIQELEKTLVENSVYHEKGSVKKMFLKFMENSIEQ